MDRRELILTVLSITAGVAVGGWPLIPYLNFRRRTIDVIQVHRKAEQALDWLDDPQLQLLCVAIRDDKPDELERLVKIENIPVDTENKQGMTATAYAIELGNVVAFERLLKLGADPNRMAVRVLRGNKAKPTTLLELILLNMQYVKPPLRQTKRLLLETALKQGVDPNFINPDDGTTAIFHADVECLDLLVRAGADLEHDNMEGRTALLDAARQEMFPQVDKVIRLLELGADYRRMDRNGLTVTDYLVDISRRYQGRESAHPLERLVLYRRALDFLNSKPDGLPLGKIRGGPPPARDRLRFIERRRKEFGLIPAPEKEPVRSVKGENP